MCCSIQLGLTQENMSKSSQRFFWFFIFQSAEGRKAHKDGLSRSDYVSMAWHWLQMHIWESPVKPVICCLYQRFVPPPPRRPVFERHPASGKAHAKGCSSSLKRLSSQGAAALWLLSGGGSQVLSATRGTQGCPSEEGLWSLLLRRWNLKAVTIYVFCFGFFWRGVTSSCLKIRSPLCVTL